MFGTVWSVFLWNFPEWIRDENKNNIIIRSEIVLAVWLFQCPMKFVVSHVADSVGRRWLHREISRAAAKLSVPFATGFFFFFCAQTWLRNSRHLTRLKHSQRFRSVESQDRREGEQKFTNGPWQIGMLPGASGGLRLICIKVQLVYEGFRSRELFATAEMYCPS